MNDLLQQLKTTHEEPRLWIERILLYAELSPPREIREIRLRPGINVVWAREREDQGDGSSSGFGHGVGKTSFCRVIRYCLGEDSFGDPAHEERVRAAFPGGGVAALIHLADETWSVLRPFGEYKRSHAFLGNQPGKLLASQADENPYGDFRARMEAVLLHGLPSELPGSKAPVRWAHLLAWCSRDQETHLSNFTTWRAGENANATAGFRRPAQDPPNLIKVVLGFLEEEESRLLNEQNSLQKELAQKKQVVEELEREPNYWHRELQARLKRRLGVEVDLPVRSTDLFGESFSTAVQDRIASLVEKGKRWQKELDGLDRELESLYAQRYALNEEKENLSSLLVLLTGETTEIQADIDRPRKERDKLLNLRGTCELGWVDFQLCSHVRERLDISNLREPRDIQEARTRLTEKVGKVSTLRSRLRECQDRLAPVEKEIAEKERIRRELTMKSATFSIEATSFQKDLDSLLEYTDIVEGKKGYPALEAARSELKDLEKRAKKTGERLLLQKTQRSEIERRLEKLWNACARRVVGADALGKFLPSDGDRPFQLLSHGGQAMRALEVLLGDWVSLLHSVAGEGKLPGFLIHDCPREADMSIGLYRRFLEAVTEWQVSLSEHGGIPFQYVVTTTSPPPPCLRGPEFKCLELHPEGDEGLLFGRRLVSQMTL